MARIIGVEIPGEKRIDIALRYIYGVGPVIANEILEKAKIDPSIRAKDLDESQMAQIVQVIQEDEEVRVVLVEAALLFVIVLQFLRAGS